MRLAAPRSQPYGKPALRYHGQPPVPHSTRPGAGLTPGPGRASRSVGILLRFANTSSHVGPLSSRLGQNPESLDVASRRRTSVEMPLQSQQHHLHLFPGQLRDQDSADKGFRDRIMERRRSRGVGRSRAPLA